ncbi:hypothetical protein ACH47Z_38280 [Streptomyces sp. NPDC020192]|uniref:hypothetical protein n=1 Tax=Streptomyces sp. NPDC020192 TaxID=3365066 RepID=UPI00378BA26C
MEDLYQWTRLGSEADVATDGVPSYAFGPRMGDGKAPLRDFAGRRPVPDRGTAPFERHLEGIGRGRRLDAPSCS